MDTIRKWTSPTEEFTVKGIDLTESDVYVTFQQGETKSTFSGENITVTAQGDDTVIAVRLSQTVTGAFTDDAIHVQINWMMDGERDGTDIVTFIPTPNLYDEVIE